MSHAVALVFTIALVAAMIVRQENAPHEAAMNSPTLQIELAPEAAPPAPRVPDAPTPEPPKPRPVHKREPARPAAAPASLPLMAESSDAPPASEVAAAAQEPDSPAPAPAPERAAAGTLEAQYAATLRTNIDARTVVPDSVEYRLQRPRGETRVNFALDRAGSVLEARIARTSGSDILDAQAVRIVKAGRYPPFPDAAFRGESRHSFLVTLEFRL